MIGQRYVNKEMSELAPWWPRQPLRARCSDLRTARHARCGRSQAAYNYSPEVDKVTTGGYDSRMKAVGVKILKAKLSEYLRLVKAGEVVLVTERDEVIAELRPSRRQKTAPSSLEDALQLLAEQGLATLRSQTESKWSGVDRRRLPKGFSTQALLDTLRGDSR